MSEINTNQHCTSEVCPYTHTHTAKWCGYEQTRECDCPYDTEAREQERERVERAARLAANSNRTDSTGRKLVDCDWDDCKAMDVPLTLEEYKLAYDHWRGHNHLGGCSHAE